MDEKKVFDVARPGSTQPDTGSKPMVIGHKMIIDPTLKAAGEVNRVADDSISSSEENVPSTLNDEKIPEETSISDTKTATVTENATTNTEEPVIAKVAPTPEVETLAEKEVTVTDESLDSQKEAKTPEEKTSEEAMIDANSDDKLKQIIKDKTYNVHIEEGSSSAVKTFVKTFLIAGLVGVAVVIGLLYTGILSLGS
jgi:hypothetical protein